MSNRPIHLSYSALAAFKACPMRFYAKYILGLRRKEQTDSQRRGTNWHELQEIVGLNPEAVCRSCADQMHPDGDCPICQGTGYLVGDSIDAAFRMLEQVYTEIPVGKTLDEVKTEQAILFYALSAYKWYYNIGEAEREYEVIDTEVPFDLDVLNPETGNACRGVRLVGKIDKIVRFLDDGSFGQVEHKSTTKPIGDDSLYWNHLKMDAQTTLYPYAMLRMQKEGRLEHLGIMPDDPISTRVDYDVFHMPGIKMRKLSIADAKKFVKTGQYFDEHFDIDGARVEIVKPESGRGRGKETLLHDGSIMVDGHPARIDNGKGGDTIYETQGMFGTRLFSDLTTRPETYFNRREIQRGIDEMARFENQIYSMYQAILMLRRTNGWWTDEHSCDNKLRCDYTSYCWHGEELSCTNILEGFENMFDKDKSDD